MDIPFPPLPQHADPTKFVNNVPPSIKNEADVEPPPCTSEVCHSIYPFSPQDPWSKDFEVRAITLFLFYFIIFYYYYNSAYGYSFSSIASTC